MNEKIDTYEPELVPQKPLDIPKKVEGFEDVMGSDGLIETKLNQKVIIQRIAKDLYADPTSGLRELYNNAVRACKVAHREFGGKQKIVVTLNYKERKLVIRDFNAIGISKERFKKILLVLGTSDNHKSGEVGQFGMGFASYTTLSSVIILTTKARVNDDSYKILGKDGASFQPLGQGDLDEYGTKLEMTLYDEVDMSELITKLEELAKFSGVTTVMELNGYDGYIHRNGATILETTTFKEYAQSHIDEDRTQSLVVIENDDYELYAIAGVSTDSNDNHVYLVNTGIESEISLTHHWWILNIKDERKFKPMPDRDRMTKEADEDLQQRIETDIKSHFSTLNIKTYDDFTKSDRAGEFLWSITEDFEYLPLDMQELAHDIDNCRFKNPGDKVLNSLVYILGNHQKIAYQNSANIRVSSKVKEISGHHCILASRTKKLKWEDMVQFLTNWGVEDTKTILKRFKVKIVREVNPNGGEFKIIGHSHTSYYHTQDCKWDDIDENFIIVDNMEMNDWLWNPKAWSNPYTFTRNEPKMHKSPARKLSDWLKDYENIVMLTSIGAQTAQEVSEWKEIMIIQNFEEKYRNIIKELSKPCVLDSNLLPLGLILKENKKKSTIKESISGVLNNLYGSSIYDEEKLVFVNDHIRKVDRCHRELFVYLIKYVHIPYRSGDYDEDEEELLQMKRVFYQITQMDKFPSADICERLKFYTKLSVGLEEEIEGEYDIVKKIPQLADKLADKTFNKIKKSEIMLGKALHALILPAMFDNISDVKVESRPVSYRTGYTVELNTTDKKFSFIHQKTVQNFMVYTEDFIASISEDGVIHVKMDVEVD